MNTHTHIPANVFPLHSAEWLYDEIMRHIEPDLMLRSVHGLQGKYLGESDAARAERMARYERAFAVFDGIYGTIAQMMMDDAHALKRQMRDIAVRKEHAEASQDLNAVERLFRHTL